MMKRRSFLKKTATAGLLTWITPSEMLTVLSTGKSASINPSFTTPGKGYAPHTWWHWMNGNISKQGITLDLEAMHAIGLGGFQMFEVGTGIPKGPISYLSQEWLEMVKHTIKECKRLDLEFTMHNCPGWSSTGGPWITPELGMQQLTWSETTVKGGSKPQVNLPEPPKRLGYYRDAFTIAFPAPSGEDTAWAAQLKAMAVNGQAIDLSLMNADGQFKTPHTFGTTGVDGYIDLIFEEPRSLKSFTMLSAGNSLLHLHHTTDGVAFKSIKSLSAESQESANSYPSYITANFDTTVSSHYRLTFRGVIKIFTLSLSTNQRIANWLSKANFPGSKPTPILSEASAQLETINPSSIINLSSHLSDEGVLDFNFPDGQWIVLRMGHTAIGRMNKSAPSTGTGLDCDKFSKTAFDFHWEQMFAQILPLMKTLEVGKIGLLIDSYELGLQNWSSNFPMEFAGRKQYDLLPYLPALTGRIVGSLELSERFLRDFRHAQAEVMADNYYGRFAERCKEHGILSYTEPYEGGNFEEMKIGQAVDISMGEFWAGHTMLYNNSVLSRTMKLAASVAHAKGQTIVGAEAFTAEPASGKWQQYPFSMKSLGDFMFTKGLTRIIFHRYAHQPHPTALPGMTMGPWGIHFDRTNTWFYKSKEWIDYLTRCQFMLRKGTFVADIAYYIGQTAPEKTIDPERSIWAPPSGYDYDLINTDTLMQCKMKNGRLENGWGMSYQLLVLPDIDVISLPVLEKIEGLVKDGLILIGKKPSQGFGVKEFLADGKFKAIVNQIWHGANGNRKGRVFHHTDLEKILKVKLKLGPDFTYTAETADPAINFIHRNEKGQDIYFITNRRRRRENILGSFRVKDKSPALWNPITGEVTPIIFYTIKDGHTVVPLLIEPSGSAFIVFTERQQPINFTDVYLNGKLVIGGESKAQKPRGIYPQLHSNFTITCWIKPEIDISLREDGFYGQRKTDHYALYPASGEKYYGQGHACSGFTVGRNGIALFERSDDLIHAVLFAEFPLSGWSKLSLVYKDNIPSIYLNHQLIKTGIASRYKVHPSVDETYQDDLASYYDGEITDIRLTSSVQPPETIKETDLVLPDPDFEHTVTMAGEQSLCLWKNGQYVLHGRSGPLKTLDVPPLPPAKELKGNWTVNIPQPNGPAKEITMEKLIGLQKHEDPVVKYFAGTAEYLIDFTFTHPTYAHQVKLDLGRVEVLAEVEVNGTKLAMLWSQPYILDITSAIQQGNNRLNIKVTNLWPNRLIGDEQFPEENEYAAPASQTKLAIGGAGGIKKLPNWYAKGLDKPTGGRTTFSTWKHYEKNSPLLESGLLGPVRVLVGALKPLDG